MYRETQRSSRKFNLNNYTIALIIVDFLSEVTKFSAIFILITAQIYIFTKTPNKISFWPLHFYPSDTLNLSRIIHLN